MPNIDLDAEDLLKWRKYYPEFAGWNDRFLDEGGEENRWYVKVSRSPTRTQALKVKRAMTLAPGDDFDPEVAILTQFMTGPHNLQINGDPVGTVMELFDLVNSQVLYTELMTEVVKEIELTEAEEGNSDGQSGGGTTSSTDASPEDSSQGSTPVDVVHFTPSEEPAPESSTLDLENDDQRSSTQPPEPGASSKTTEASE